MRTLIDIIMEEIICLPGNFKISAPIYEGNITDVMPRLIQVHKKPLSIREIMEQKVNFKNSNNNKLNPWQTNFCSGDGIMYHPDGRIKVVPDSQTLYNNSDILLKKFGDWNGTQILQEGTFNSTQGFEFTRKEVEKFANKKLTKERVLENPIWNALVQEDKRLLGEYIEQLYSDNIYYVLIKFNCVMRVFISGDRPNFEAQKLWYFDSAFNDVVDHPPGYNGRFVGIGTKVGTGLVTNQRLESLLS